MKRCKLIINKMSGNGNRLDHCEEKIESLILKNYEKVDIVYIDENHNIKMSEELDGYDALAVCGGDGTLNSAINAVKNRDIELIYIPCGTLNDTAKSLKLAKFLRGNDERTIRRVDLGNVGDTMFAYVLAGGTFTAIGYKTKIKTKKRLKILAYLFMVLKEYKVHRIEAKIELPHRTLEDTYTLMMVVNSTRCFGFHFNKIFSHNDGNAQLLLIKAPKSQGFFGKIAIFFPLFRAFFIGFRKESDGKRLKFLTVREGSITLKEKNVFTVDGEKIELNGKNDFEILKQRLNLVVF